MSAVQTRAALDAIAFQLLGALRTYEESVDRMIAAWPDLDRYQEASEAVEEIRTYSAAVPEARVQWVELLVAHAELVHQLWRLQYGDCEAAQEQLAPVREHHGDAVTALRIRCEYLVARAFLGTAG
jgi:hypothetical protein